MTEEREDVRRTMLRYGRCVVRIQELKDLDAPLVLIEHEKKQCGKYRQAVVDRIFEAVEYVQENLDDWKKVTPGKIIEEMPDICTIMGDNWYKWWRAHERIEHLNDFETSDTPDTGTTVILVWEDIGEGMSGDYNADDPNDVALLRFNISKRVYDDKTEGGGYDRQIDNGSFCTHMPTDTPWYLMEHGLKCIWNEVKNALNAGESIKRICEKISWCEPKWFEEGNHWEYKEGK